MGAKVSVYKVLGFSHSSGGPERVYQWAKEVNMVFNSEKFECLRFWPGKQEKPDTVYHAPDGSEIEEKEHLRDLGVKLGNDLTFSIQINSAVSKVNQLIGWALRTFRRRSPFVMSVLWNSLIQPHLDYCCQLWCPCDQMSIGKLESTQRHFTSKILGCEEKNYWERLKFLNILSQERRRERSRIIFIWKILQGYVEGYTLESSSSDRRGRTVVVPPYHAKAPASVRRAEEASLRCVFTVHASSMQCRDISGIFVLDQSLPSNTSWTIGLALYPTNQQSKIARDQQAQTQYLTK